MISLIIQSRWTVAQINHSIHCFANQSISDAELIFVIDEIMTKEFYEERIKKLDIPAGRLDKKIRIFSNLNASFTHHNVSAMRNFAIQQAKWDFLNFMDDDEDFPANYFERSLQLYHHHHKIYKKDLMICPTLMYRHTGKIQNQGFSHYNFRYSRPIACELGAREYAEIQMYSGNSLFAPKSVFAKNHWDERFDFVNEDLTFTYGCHKNWVPIIVSKDLKIFHMERDKTKLEDARIGNAFQAYKKSKHRILFVHKFASLREKIQFYVLWFIGQPARLIARACLLAKGKQRRSIIAAIFRGTWDGLLIKD